MQIREEGKSTYDKRFLWNLPRMNKTFVELLVISFLIFDFDILVTK